ncbi:Hypothetical protein D9617_19g102310 [Elsinoe fawcettii]|nr:Hypothetical protein D9617_19g102310 [Elsinoe fawcettii]
MSEHERQMDELVLLQSMYPEEFSWQKPPDPEADLATIDDQQFFFKLRIQAYMLEVTLPLDYPTTSKPKAYLQCGETIPTATRKEARSALDQLIASLEVGTECLDVLIQDLTAKLDSLEHSAESIQQDHAVSNDQQSADQSGTEQKIKLVLLWSHHLLATSKRKDIVSWSRELHLSGFSRPGYPGAIIIEGEEADVDEFETRIKALRWQALQVRGEETTINRRLVSIPEMGTPEPLGMTEVEDLSDVVKALRSCEDRLGDWFLQCMKIGHG